MKPRLLSILLLLMASGCGSKEPYHPTEPIYTPTIRDDAPAWSPNGQFIAYIHYASIDEDIGYPQIWLYDLQVDSSYCFIYPAVQARWSLDNSVMAFLPGPLADIYYYYFDLDTIIRITYDGYHGGFDISSSGNTIVTNITNSNEYGLWLFDINGNHYRDLTPGRPGGDTPFWSRYSGQILYNRADEGSYYQFGISDSFGNFLGYIHETSWLQYQACWGPADTMVALTNGLESYFNYQRTQIFFKNRHTGQLEFFTFGWSPDWSYDGQWLAFADRAENPYRFAIWIMRPDGTGKREISRRSYADDTVGYLTDDVPRCVLPEAVRSRLKGE